MLRGVPSVLGQRKQNYCQAQACLCSSAGRRGTGCMTRNRGGGRTVDFLPSWYVSGVFHCAAQFRDLRIPLALGTDETDICVEEEDRSRRRPKDVPEADRGGPLPRNPSVTERTHVGEVGLCGSPWRHQGKPGLPGQAVLVP